MPRKRIDDGIPVRAPRSNNGIRPHLPLLILVGLALALIVGGCGLLAAFTIDRFYKKNGNLAPLGQATTDDAEGDGKVRTVSGTIVRFYLGDRIEFFKEKNGNMNMDTGNYALELRTKDGRLIDCLFADKDPKVLNLLAGDRVSLRGEYVVIGPGAIQLRNCRIAK